MHSCSAKKLYERESSINYGRTKKGSPMQCDRNHQPHNILAWKEPFQQSYTAGNMDGKAAGLASFNTLFFATKPLTRLFLSPEHTHNNILAPASPHAPKNSTPPTQQGSTLDQTPTLPSREPNQPRNQARLRGNKFSTACTSMRKDQTNLASWKGLGPLSPCRRLCLLRKNPHPPRDVHRVVSQPRHHPVLGGLDGVLRPHQLLQEELELKSGGGG